MYKKRKKNYFFLIDLDIIKPVLGVYKKRTSKGIFAFSIRKSRKTTVNQQNSFL
jgi:hypothetical protein